MANIRPFQAIRPKEELAANIAALPYDVYSSSEARAEVAKEPYSFLRVDRAETQLDVNIPIYDQSVYEKAKEVLEEMIEKGELISDPKPCYYIYQLTMHGRSQTGIVACASIDDYDNQVIKKHENTRKDKELDRIHHVDICNAHTGPIFLAYRGEAAINEIVKNMQANIAPIYDFTAEDGIIHKVWSICEQKDIDQICKSFSYLNAVYIADGHHRCASAVAVGHKRREENPNFTGEEEFNYFLSVLFPGEELMIMDYNRVVKDLNGLTNSEFLQRVESAFAIERIESGQYKPNKKGNLAMFLENTWYSLTARGSIFCKDPVKGLDVSLLQNYILSPILGIDDPKTDKRIDFVGGIRGLEELEKRVATDSAVAFAMYPTSIEELFAVSDAGLLMPPKSTWFEPKLRSGLFIHRF